jgi:ureidoacrylate peracid hydrolase
MGYKPDLSDLGAPNSVNRVRHLRLGVGEKITAPDGNESRILIRDTWNTDIVPQLEPQAGDDIVYKTRFSGFFETDLDARLKKLGVTHLIIAGALRVSVWIQPSGTRCSGTTYASCWPTA